MVPRRKDYRAYWCGFIRCFFCAVWNNGTTFQRWAIFTQFLLLAGIPGAIFAPWLEITYKTGNHLERVRPTFALIDGNGNNKLEFTELSNFFKDLNQVFFGSYFRNDAELARSLLIDRDSPCLPAALQALQGACGIGDRAVCLQSDNWMLEGNNPMRDPVKIQKCFESLMDSSYISRTGDDCVQQAMKDDWLNPDSKSDSAACVRGTSIDIEEFSLFGRHMTLGLPESEKSVSNHCINATFTSYFSIYGLLSVIINVQMADDMSEPRCHSVLKPLKDRNIAQKNFLCITAIDYWGQNAVDLGNSIDPLKPPVPPQCRGLAEWIDDVFQKQYEDFGCNVTCTPGGKAELSAGCVPSVSAGQRLNRAINSPYRPTCSTRIGTGIVGDACPRFATCPSCSLATNHTGLVPHVTARENVHPGTSGMSAIYDTMCVIGESIYIRDLRKIVRVERARDDRARQQGLVFQSKMVASCQEKIRQGDYAEGELTVTESTKLMTAYPDSNPGRKVKGDELSCTCRVNSQCESCIKDCVGKAFFLPESRSTYTTSVDCSRSDLNQVMRTEGAAAFPPQDATDPYAQPPAVTLGPYNRSDPLRWECNGANCSKAPGALDSEFPYTGSVVEYASPLPVLGVWQLFLVLCPIGRVIVFLYAGAGCLQLYNLYMMWLVMRASDDLNNADSWNQEMLVLKGLVLTTLVIFTPASLYGGYITVYGDTLRWGAYHRLSVGWGLSLLLSVVALMPFYGAWKSFKSRPIEWRNAVSRFQRDKTDTRLASVVPLPQPVQMQKGGLSYGELAGPGLPASPGHARFSRPLSKP